MSVVFSSPSVLVGLAAAGLPVIIHLINRRRVKEVLFPPTWMLLEIARRRAKSLMVQHWLLLLLRTLIIALVVLVLARPLWRRPRPILAALPPAGRVAVVVDDSYSTGYQLSQENRFEAMKQAAGGLVDGASPQIDLAVTTTGKIVTEGLPSFQNRRLARREVDSLEPGYGRCDMGQVIAALSELSREVPLQAWILTDDTALSWIDFDPGDLGSLAGDLDLKILVFSLPAEAANLEVVSLAPAAAGRGLEIRIANGGRVPSGPKSVEVGIGTASCERFLVSIDPGREQSLLMPVESGEEALIGKITIAADPLPIDNTFFFNLSAPPPGTVLIINGKIAPVGPERPDFFLVRALAPGKNISSPVPIMAREASEGFPDDLGRFKAVIAAEAPLWKEGEWKRLKSFAQNGGGVLIYPSPEMAGRVLPPSAADLAPPSPLTFQTLEPSLSVRPEALSDRIWTPFRQQDMETLSRTEIRAVYRPAGPVSDWETLLASSAGDPILIRRLEGIGSIWWFLIPPGLSGGELPLNPVFLPFIQETARALAAPGAFQISYRREESPPRMAGGQAINPPKGEGNLAPISVEGIRDLTADLPGPVSVSSVEDSRELIPVDRDLTHFLLVALIGLLLTEGWLSERRLIDGRNE